jgi:hypothetical protein
MKRDRPMGEKELRTQLKSHGFSIANLAFRLIESGKLLEYRMVIRSRDRACTEKWSRHLLERWAWSNSGSRRPATRPALAPSRYEQYANDEHWLEQRRRRHGQHSTPGFSAITRRPMRILAFSDLHRNRDIAHAIVDASREADVVVGAGDFATKGIGLHETIDLLCAVTVPTILVAGNHDRLDELRDACRDSETIHILHGEGVLIEGVSFFGLGFEIPAGRDERWNQRLDESEAAKRCMPARVALSSSPMLRRLGPPTYKRRAPTKVAVQSAIQSCLRRYDSTYAVTSITLGECSARSANVRSIISAQR